MIANLQAHYAFSRMPFTSAVPVPAPYASAAHKEAVARLRWLISARGLGVLTGEVGSAKTVALRAAADGLYASHHTLIYLPNPQIGVRGIHGALAMALCQAPRFYHSTLIPQVEAALAAEADERNRDVVLAVDESHLLTGEQLEAVRMLTNWLATTTRRECLRVLRAAREPLAAGYRLDAQILPAEQTGTAEQELLVAERHAALREAFLALSPSDQRLIGLLLEDPPVPYAQISSRLGIPVGSIGPHRGRCLDKLRRHPATAALINTEAHSTRSDINGQPMVQ